MFKKILLLLSLLVALSVAVGAARAQGSPPTDDDVNRIAKKLFCPVCENTPLDVCPTLACAQWRATIREKLAAGWTEQQILDYFVAQYGERVLAQPSTRGLNIFVWVIPPVALAAGAFVLWRFLRQMAPRPASALAPPIQSGAAPSTAPVDEYAQRLEKELKQRR